MSDNRRASPPPGLSDSELAVLKVLWEQGPSTVREVNDQLSKRGRQWAYTTVQTLLTRLQQKGCVESDKGDIAHRYLPTVSRDQLLQQRLGELETELCGGLATPIVHALVTSKQFTKDDIAHFRRLLDELESAGNQTRKPRSTLQRPKR